MQIGAAVLQGEWNPRLFQMELMNKIRLFVLSWAFLNVTGQLVSADESKFILLKSGTVIEGVATQGRDRSKTTIRYPNGDYLQIDSRKVERSFQSMKDLFNYRIAVTPMSGLAQNRLLEWLIKNGQFDLAAKQLDELKSSELLIDFGRFEKQVASIQTRPLNRTRRAIDDQTQVRTIGDQNADQQVIARQKTQKEFHARQKQEFQSNVQNHLVFGCGLSGCHTRDSGRSFKLDYDFGKPLTDEQASRNYDLVTEFIRSDSRKFLELADQPHGDLRKGIYRKNSREYRTIATWVNHHVRQTSLHEKLLKKDGNLVDQSAGATQLREQPVEPNPVGPAGVAKVSSLERPGIKKPKSVPELGRYSPSGNLSGRAATRNPTGTQVGSGTSIPGRTSEESTAKSGPFTIQATNPGRFLPVDEFDPEIFNRKMNLRRSQQQKTETQQNESSDASPQIQPAPGQLSNEQRSNIINPKQFPD